MIYSVCGGAICVLSDQDSLPKGPSAANSQPLQLVYLFETGCAYVVSAWWDHKSNSGMTDEERSSLSPQSLEYHLRYAMYARHCTRNSHIQNAELGEQSHIMPAGRRTRC